MSRLPRPVRLFGIVSLFNDFASEMVYPLLPAFVTTVLGAGPAALGALDGASDFAAAAVKYGAGRLADRPQRRGPLVIAGYALAVIVRPIIALATAAWQVVGLRVGDRLGKGIRSAPRDAIIADVTLPALRGRAFGFQRGLDHVGAVLGPLAAWALLAAGSTPRDVIAASVIPGVVVLVVAVWAVRSVRGWRTVELGQPSTNLHDVHQPSPTLTILPIAIFHLLRMPETLLILRSQDLGVPVAAVPLLWAAVHVVKSLASFAGGGLADRVGAARTMWVGWAGYAALAAGFAIARAPIQAWVLFLGLGVVAGLTEPPERALVAQAAGDRQGRGFGAFHGATGLAALAGALALGVAYQRWGGAVAFWASAGVALVLTALGPALLTLGRHRSNEKT